MTAARPRFSVVIPTRNRPATLPFTLRTCLAQAFDGFEVLVSDNASDPGTREVVESFDDPRIRYVRTPGPLSLTDSLEFAVGAAEGEFVTLLGDDDALLRHALVTLDQLLRLTQTRALRWEGVVYHWPDLAPQPFARPNTLLVPLRQTRGGHRVRRLRSELVIRAVASFQAPYSELPSPFTAAVHREVFAALRARTGRIFRSRTPDVYFALAAAQLLGAYDSLDAPLSVAGLSSSSTGVARHYQPRGNHIDEDFRARNDAAGHRMHSEVPDLPPISSAVADAFLWVKEGLGLDWTYTLDRVRLIESCLSGLHIGSAEDWRSVLAECRRSLGDDLALLAWFERDVSMRPPPSTPRAEDRRYGGDHLSLDASDFGVRNVEDAVELCERLLGYARDGLRAYVQEGSDGGLTTSTELEEKEACIQRLARINAEQNATIERLYRDSGPAGLLRGLARRLAWLRSIGSDARSAERPRRSI